MRSNKTAGATFTFRVDPDLKAKFVAATERENRPASEVLRDFMWGYVEHKRRRQFEAEARRQSRLIARSAEEQRIMDWIRDVSDIEDWK